MTFVIARFGEYRPQHNINYMCDLYIFCVPALFFYKDMPMKGLEKYLQRKKSFSNGK